MGIEFDGLAFSSPEARTAYIHLDAADRQKWRDEHARPMAPPVPSDIVIKAAPHVGSPPTQPDHPSHQDEQPALEPNTDGMIRCLHWLRPGAEGWLLTTINPVAKEGSRNATTFYLKDDAMAPAQLRDGNLAALNVYFPTGTPRPTWDAATKNQPR